MKKHLHFYCKPFGDVAEIYKILDETNEYKLTYHYYETGERTGPDKADFCVTSHHTDDRLKGKIIHVQHGFGVASKVPHRDKKAFADDYIAHYDALALYGHRQAQDYVSMGFPKDNIMVIGCPSSIPLLEPVDEQDRTDFLTELNLDPSKETVCYIPSWDMGTKRGLFALWYEDGKERERVREFCEFVTKKHNKNLIIRLHEAHRYSKCWGSEYADIFKVYGVFFTYLNSYPSATKFLKYSDYFLGDYSNTNTYVYTMGKPIVHIEKNLPRWENKDGGWPVEDRAGYNLCTFSGILYALDAEFHCGPLFKDRMETAVKKNIAFVGEECKQHVINEFRRITCTI